MPLVMTADPGDQDDATPREVWLPVVVCDWCGRRIATAAEGTYHWLADRPGDGDREVGFLHTTCFPGFARTHRDRGERFSHPLGHLIGGLVGTLGGDADTAIATAAALARTAPSPSGQIVNDADGERRRS